MCIGENPNYENAELLATLQKNKKNNSRETGILSNKLLKKKLPSEFLQVILNEKEPMFNRENALTNYCRKVKGEVDDSMYRKFSTIFTPENGSQFGPDIIREEIKRT